MIFTCTSTLDTPGGNWRRVSLDLKSLSLMARLPLVPDSVRKRTEPGLPQSPVRVTTNAAMFGVFVPPLPSISWTSETEYSDMLVFDPLLQFDPVLQFEPVFVLDPMFVSAPAAVAPPGTRLKLVTPGTTKAPAKKAIHPKILRRVWSASGSCVRSSTLIKLLMAGKGPGPLYGTCFVPTNNKRPAKTRLAARNLGDQTRKVHGQSSDSSDRSPGPGRLRQSPESTAIAACPPPQAIGRVASVDGPMACALFTPISPAEPGNGLAHRARFWRGVLERLGPVTTVLVPLAGPSLPGDELVIPLVAPMSSTEFLPRMSQQAPEHVGRSWGADQAPFDLVLVLRAYTAPFALGAVAGTDASVVVDLDDDDADLLGRLGDHDEARRFVSLVASLGRRADRVVSVTGFGGSVAVPNSVEMPPGGHSRPVADGRKLLMVGNFGYPPNADGARWFVDEVLPLVVAATPDVELSLVGPGSEAFPRYGRGYREDLAACYSDAAVALVPLLHGSGTRIKAVEAFAHRVPVVGTSVGLEGIGAVDGVHCLIRDEPRAFAAGITDLLEDAVAAAALAERACAEVAPRYAVGTVAAAAAALLRDVASRRHAVYDRAPRSTVAETEDGLIVMDEVSMTAHHLNPFTAAVYFLVEGGVDQPKLIQHAASLLTEAAPADLPDAVAAAVSLLERSGLVVRCGGGGQSE